MSVDKRVISQSCISGITLLIEMAMEYGSSPVAHPVLQMRRRRVRIWAGSISSSSMANTGGGNTTIGCLLRRGEFRSTRGFLGLEDGNARQVKSLEALILIQATAGWQGIACQLCHALIRGLPFTSIAQEAHVTGLVDH